MKILVTFLAIIGLAGSCLAQAPANPSSEELTQILPGMLIPADLSKSIDAKKAKVGDQIELKTSMDMISHGQIVIPRGSKIVAKITSAKPHTKEAPDSELGIAFDRIFITNGKELPMKASVQAIGLPIIVNNNPFGAPAGVGPQPPPGQSSNNIGSSDAPGTALSSTQQVASMNGSTPTSSSAGNALTSESHGAVGMKNLTLTGGKESNTITSNKQNVKLDSGTQFMLKTE